MTDPVHNPDRKEIEDALGRLLDRPADADGRARRARDSLRMALDEGRPPPEGVEAADLAAYLDGEDGEVRRRILAAGAAHAHDIAHLVAWLDRVEAAAAPLPDGLRAATPQPQPARPRASLPWWRRRWLIGPAVGGLATACLVLAMVGGRGPSDGSEAPVATPLAVPPSAFRAEVPAAVSPMPKSLELLQAPATPERLQAEPQAGGRKTMRQPDLSAAGRSEAFDPCAGRSSPHAAAKSADGEAEEGKPDACPSPAEPEEPHAADQ